MKKMRKTYAEQTEGIDKSELDRSKSAGECERCAWPADRKWSHRTMDCFCWIRKDKETAPFPKAKEYQKLKVGADDLQESDIGLYMTDAGEGSDEKFDLDDEKESQEQEEDEEDL